MPWTWDLPAGFAAVLSAHLHAASDSRAVSMGVRCNVETGRARLDFRIERGD
jgi:hypothetical protein